MRCLREEVERLDAELASLARVETALRLRLGQVLEVLSRGACFELGFSSLAAYVLERCDRSVRWAEGARCLARRVERLPELRRAMAFGNVSWSMGELLARVAQPEDEACWIECAESRTVRQVRELVVQALSEVRAARGAEVDAHAANGVARTCEGSDASVTDDDGKGDDVMCTLTCTVDQEDAWLFEATRALLGQLGEHDADAQSQALLAEAQGTLLAALPCSTGESALDGEGWEWLETDQQRWLRKLARWRAEAEALCEERIRRSLSDNGEPEPVRCAVALAAARGLASLERAGAEELDGNVRDLAGSLARHELELSRRLLRFHRADGWRRLGTRPRRSTHASASVCRSRQCWPSGLWRCGSRSCRASPLRSGSGKLASRQRGRSCAWRRRAPRRPGSSEHASGPSNACEKKWLRLWSQCACRARRTVHHRQRPSWPPFTSWSRRSSVGEPIERGPRLIPTSRAPWRMPAV